MNKIYIVTVATDEKYYFKYLKESCKKNGSELVVLGAGEKWKGFNWRFKLILNYINTLNDDDIVCVIDGYDVICTRKLDELKDIFIRIQSEKQCKIIVGYDNLEYMNSFLRLIISINFGKCDNVSLNAGTYIGYVKDIKNLIKSLQSLNSDDDADDQKLLTKYYGINSNDVYIDTENEIFCTVAKTFNEIDDLFKFEDGTIIHNDHKPFFLHAPGATYLDNVIIKLGYNYDYDDKIKSKMLYKWVDMITWIILKILACVIVLVICIKL
jgi:hypothetical protein